MAKLLVTKNEYGLFANSEGTVMISSLDVARIFEKLHKNIVRDIDKIIQVQPEFGKLNFEPSYYKSKQGKKCTCYNMTRDGFVFLVMGFTGEKANSCLFYRKISIV